jgi:hypothetical protein
MDAVSYAFERMIGAGVGRANLPRGRAALKERLAEIGRALAERLADEQAVDDMLRFAAGFRWPREGYDLPGLIEDADERFRVKAAGVRLVSQGNRHGLVRDGSRQAVEVPAAIQPQLAWVLGRERFGRAELARAFPGETPPRLDQLLADLTRMALIEPAV